MKPRHLLLGAALAAAAALAAFSDSSPDAGVVEAAAPNPARPAAPLRAAAGTAPARDSTPSIQRVQPRAELFGEDADSLAGGGNLFLSHDWTPPPPPAPVARLPPPPSPNAPPLPFSYIGKALEGGKWEVYLARADKTYVVHAQAVIDGAWRVDAIAPPVLTLTYLPLNHVQQLNIGAFD